jgi:hypothetical protein
MQYKCNTNAMQMQYKCNTTVIIKCESIITIYNNL